MTLNLATAAFFTALVEFALGIGMLTLWSREGRKYLIYWSSGFFTFGFGSFLISMRGKIPDFFSIIFANLSTTLSSILFFIGICIFFNRRRSGVAWMVAMLCLEGALLAYYTYGMYDTQARVYVYSAAQALIVLMTLWMLAKVRRERRESSNPEIVAVTLLFLLVHSARLIGTPFFPAPRDFLTSGNFQTLLSFGLMMTHISYALAFGNMHASALNTDLKAALEDSRAKDRQKIEVLGYISHDLRAPLAIISGYSSLLLNEASESRQKILSTIQRSVKYQLNLIDELLEYARAELQPLAIQPVATDLFSLIRDISDYATALCSQRNNDFRLQISSALPPQVELDGKRLKQVLLNLISNAAKYTCDGVVILSIDSRQNDNGCVLQFSVSDTGAGIDLSQHTEISSISQKTKSSSGNYGLGLIIANKIISAMGGKLTADSTINAGTKFYFSFFAMPIASKYSELSTFSKRHSQAESKSPSKNPISSINSKPEAAALDELAEMALNGRYSDIENWIEHHANEKSHEPFIGLLQELLERFDFSGIRALALHNDMNSDLQ